MERTRRAVAATALVVAVLVAGLGAPAAPAAGLRPAALPHDAPDPFVLTDGGRHWLFSTNVFPFGFTLNVPVRVSDDLVSWEHVGDALPTLGAWATPGSTWAPGVLRTGAGFVLYYVARDAASGRQCIGTATAPVAAGPYAPAAEPLVCPAAAGGAIDPDPYVAPDGRLYLHWKVDANAVGGTVVLEGRELAASGTSFAAGSSTVALLTALGPTTWERGIVENPAMVAGAGATWLLFSGGEWETAGYGVGVARCAGPLGPCTRVGSGPWLSSGASPAGLGGATTFRDRAGRLRLVFHGWPGAVGYGAGGERWTYVEPLDIGPDGPVLRGDLPVAATHPAAWRPFATPEALVARQYVDLLGRGADPVGLAAWSAAIRDGVADGPGVTAGIFGSPEYAGIAEPVTRLYFAAFARMPDPAGLRGWIRARRAGTALAEVATAFAGSAEFAGRYAGTDDAGFVDALYRNALGRPADAHGLAAWTAQLRGGATRGQVLLAIADSAEHRSRVGSEVKVVGAYLGFLGRAPDPTGYAGWTSYLDSGASLRAFVAGIIGSMEYAGRVSAGS